MAKTQLNFRIEEELLKAIKKEAKRHGKNHTQWIIEQCQKGLDRQPVTLEELSEQLAKTEKQLTNINERLTRVEEQKNSKTVSIEAIASEEIEPEAKTPNTGLTHAELARQLGVSASAVSRWGTGKRKPPEDLQYEFDPTLKRWVKKRTK